uniref:Pyrroline-5-carboxylate reductase 3 n=1 Tax=Corvus moneduloides TaxID=1196302 RepID=A0A8C3DU08_CORMO
MLGCPSMWGSEHPFPPQLGLAHPSQVWVRSRQSLGGFVARTGPQAMFLPLDVLLPWGHWFWGCQAVTPLPVPGQELGCRTTHCNLEVVHRSTLVFLATKPHILPGVLEEIRPAVGSHHIVVSLVAGVTIQTLQRVRLLLFLLFLSPSFPFLLLFLFSFFPSFFSPPSPLLSFSSSSSPSFSSPFFFLLLLLLLFLLFHLLLFFSFLFPHSHPYLPSPPFPSLILLLPFSSFSSFSFSSSHSPLPPFLLLLHLHPGLCRTHCCGLVPTRLHLQLPPRAPHFSASPMCDTHQCLRHPWVLCMAGTPSPIPIFFQLLPPWTKVLRIMPNLPCVVQAGAMVFSRGSNAGDEEAALLKSLLSSCGLCEEVPESYIDIHTGLSGSGVAYVYLFAEALAEGAVKMGMPGALASRIAAQTLLGAAKMLLETGEHPAKLRGDVCTPGGTTIYALYQLEKGALRATVMDAVEAATNRACDMAKD